MNDYTAHKSPYVRNIATDLLLTLLTCGLFNLYIQHQQMLALNEMLRQQKYSFMQWLLLSLVTCGLYHIYHEYRMSDDIARLMKGSATELPLITVLLSLFALSFVTDAIQQSKINEYFGNSQL